MQCPPKEELNRMTLQVGLVGIDGIVIASDRLLQQWETDGSNSGYSLSLTSKFEQGNGFISCASGDKLSELVSSNICKVTWDVIKHDVRAELKAVANATWENFVDAQYLSPATRKIIVVCPDRSAWVIDASSSNAAFANRIYNKVVAGDVKNTARHIINNYLPNDQSPLQLPVSKLIVPAAHAILMGGRENPSGVGGLEVAIVPNDGQPMILSLEREREITAISERIYRQTKKLLLQPFLPASA